jgi:hypothetical protein
MAFGPQEGPIESVMRRTPFVIDTATWTARVTWSLTKHHEHLANKTDASSLQRTPLTVQSSIVPARKATEGYGGLLWGSQGRHCLCDHAVPRGALGTNDVLSVPVIDKHHLVRSRLQPPDTSKPQPQTTHPATA